MTELRKNLIKIFTELSEVEQIKNREFPSRAFASVAKFLEQSDRFKVTETSVVLRNSNTNQLKVLGSSCSKVFIEYYKYGTCSRLENEPIHKSDLTNVSGIGPVKRLQLLKAGIITSDDLMKLNLPIGSVIPGTEITFTSMMSTGLKLWDKTRGVRISHAEAEEYISSFKSEVRDDIYVVGSYRRQKPTVGDIDIIMLNNGTDYSEKIVKWLDEVFVHGDTKISGIKGKTQVDIRMIDPKYLGAHLLHGTGSQEFNIKIRAYAKSLGMRLNEYGILDQNQVFHTFSTEEEIFKFLNYDYVSPEMR